MSSKPQAKIVMDVSTMSIPLDFSFFDLSPKISLIQLNMK